MLSKTSLNEQHRRNTEEKKEGKKIQFENMILVS